MSSSYAAIAESTRPHLRWMPLWDILGVAGLMALGALLRFPLPFSPVPVTLQTFVALSAGFIVGPRRAAAGIGLYALLGGMGAPLFAVHSGATWGYIAAMGLAPFLASACGRPMIGLLAATALIYAIGVLWLCWWVPVSFPAALAVGVFPFLPGDLAKILAARAFVRWQRHQD